jgi:O-antigen ligase
MSALRRLWPALVALTLVLLPWYELGDPPTGLAVVHLLALAAILLTPTLAPAPLAGGMGTGWLAAWLAWVALSALGGGYRFSALLETWNHWVAVLWFLALAHAPLAAPQRRRLVAVLAAAAALHAAWALERSLAGGQRSGGAFVNANFLAAHLNVALPAAVWLAVAGRGWRRWLAGGASALLAAALFTSGSRGGLWLGTIAALAVAVPYRRIGPAVRSHPRLAAAGLLAAAAGIGLGVAAWIELRDLGADPYAYHRLKIWERSLAVWRDHPWAGVGAGQLQWVAPALQFPLEEGPFRYSRFWTSAHSTPLHLLAERGIIGALLGAGFLLALLRALRARSRSEQGGLARASIAALAAVGAHGIVDTPMESAAVTFFLAAFLGLALGPSLAGAGAEERAGASRTRTVALRFGVPGLALIAMAAWGALAAPWIAHRAFLRFGRETDPRRALAAVQQALRWNPHQAFYAYGFGRAVSRASGSLGPRQVALAEIWLEQASALNPFDGRSDTERGHLMKRAAEEGALPVEAALRAALRRYEEAMRRRPLDARIRLYAGIAALRLGDLRRAGADAQAALDLEPSFLDALLLRADAEARSADKGRTRDTLRRFREARAALASWEPRNEYERDLVKYNEPVLVRLERAVAE